MTILNEEKKYQEFTESIRIMNNQRSDVEKNVFIQEGKKIGMKFLRVMKLLIAVSDNKYKWV